MDPKLIEQAQQQYSKYAFFLSLIKSLDAVFTFVLTAHNV
jgi:hypothetical protein